MLPDERGPAFLSPSSLSEHLLGLAPAHYGIYVEVKVDVALGLSRVNFLELRVEISILTRRMCSRSRFEFVFELECKCERAKCV